MKRALTAELHAKQSAEGSGNAENGALPDHDHVVLEVVHRYVTRH